jgi:hypothetical protein
MEAACGGMIARGFRSSVATYFWAKASKSKQKTPFQDL